jgi:hypothetical protein
MWNRAGIGDGSRQMPDQFLNDRDRPAAPGFRDARCYFLATGASTGARKNGSLQPDGEGLNGFGRCSAIGATTLEERSAGGTRRAGRLRSCGCELSPNFAHAATVSAYDSRRRVGRREPASPSSGPGGRCRFRTSSSSRRKAPDGAVSGGGSGMKKWSRAEGVGVNIERHAGGAQPEISLAKRCLRAGRVYSGFYRAVLAPGKAAAARVPDGVGGTYAGAAALGASCS